ncbi:MAG: glycosyltransferase [Candidatus Levyibacteriota bacterium]
MKIGIDISQTAYTKTGTANYIKNLTEALLKIDKNNEYVLFFSSLRRGLPYIAINPRTTVKKFRFPPSILSLIWNKWHILPIENLIGDVDIFITSDWTEPPVKKAKKASIIYDLIVYRYPKETHKKIIKTQRSKLRWLKKEEDVVFCISDSTRKDVDEILGIDKSKLKVAYPGI